jgi:hypothetical protein
MNGLRFLPTEVVAVDEGELVVERHDDHDRTRWGDTGKPHKFAGLQRGGWGGNGQGFPAAPEWNGGGQGWQGGENSEQWLTQHGLTLVEEGPAKR